MELSVIVDIKDVHTIRRRAAFVKQIIGHIAGHFGLHHPRHTDCEDKHFHHFHGSTLDHLHNSHFGHKFLNHGDENPSYGHNQNFPEEKKHGIDLQPYTPHLGPDIHHTNFHNNGNPDFHGFNKDRPDHKQQTPEEKKVEKGKPAIYPPFHEHDGDDNDPVSDFDWNNDEKPVVGEKGTVDRKNNLPGKQENVGNGEDDHHVWMDPEEEDQNNEGGVIPSTSQIDIRFRKH